MPKKRRPKRVRHLSPVFHIFCEGEKTEPNYFNCYLDRYHPGNRRLRVIKIEDTKKNTPVQLVEEAIKLKCDRSCPKHDMFWVVYDRERVAKYSDELHCQTFSAANKYDVKVAISNVCFEIWILLHFEANTASYSCYEDLIKNSNLSKVHIKDYAKGDKGIFATFVKNVEDAKNNAIAMNSNTIKNADRTWTKPYQWNPYTDVYKLLDAIDEFDKS